MNSLFGGFDLSVSTKPKVSPEVLIKKAAPTAMAEPQKITNQSLFASEELSEFNVELNKPKPEALARKIANPNEGEVDATKILKSKKVSLAEKLALIKIKVLEVLGKQRKNVVVIKTKEDVLQLTRKQTTLPIL